MKNAFTPISLVNPQYRPIGKARGPERRRNQGARALHEAKEREQTEEEAEAEEARHERWMQHYGDKREKTKEVEEHLVRIMTYNINTFPKVGTIKQDRIKHEKTASHA